MLVRASTILARSLAAENQIIDKTTDKMSEMKLPARGSPLFLCFDIDNDIYNLGFKRYSVRKKISISIETGAGAGIFLDVVVDCFSS